MHLHNYSKYWEKQLETIEIDLAQSYLIKDNKKFEASRSYQKYAEEQLEKAIKLDKEETELFIGLECHMSHL